MNQVAIITGTAGNLGHAVARTLLDKGYEVHGTMLHDQQTPELTAIESFSRWELDVTDEEACKNFVENMPQEVNLAALIVGGFGMGNLENTSQKDIQHMIRLNFESTFNMGKALFTKMKQQPGGGRIVMMGAKPAFNPASGTFAFAYTLSKTLVHHFAEMLNAEGKDHGIVASVVVPSIIDTSLNRKAMPDTDFDKWAKPAEIAEIIAFLGSDPASILRNPVMKVYKDA